MGTGAAQNLAANEITPILLDPDVIAPDDVRLDAVLAELDGRLHVWIDILDAGGDRTDSYVIPFAEAVHFARSLVTAIRDAVRLESEAIGLAVTLNCARRHLTREQVREVIRAEIGRCPGDSDRAIARRVGCSPSTVGAVRGEAVSKLDTAMSAPEAEARTVEIRRLLFEARKALVLLSMEALSNKIAAAEIVMAFTAAIRQMQRDGRDEHDVIGKYVYGPVIDWLLDPATTDEFRPEWDHDTFTPYTETEKAALLAALAGSTR